MNKKIREYTKAKVLIFLTLSLLCWANIDDASSYNATKSEDKIMYAIFRDKFTEPIEIVYFLMNDMALYRATSNCENRVFLNMWVLKKDFKRNGHTVSDVIVIIHNHTKDAYFSNDDIDTYRTFKDAGFEGKYCLYVYRKKAIYELAKDFR